MPTVSTFISMVRRAAAWTLISLGMAGAPHLGLSNPAAAQALPLEERDQTLIIGRITTLYGKQYKKLEALNDYLVTKLASAGITRGKVVLAADMAQMIPLLQTNQVDYLSETAYTALKLEAGGHADILLHEWKNGHATYRSLFVAPKSGIARIADLPGHRLVLEDADSTSGYMMPILYLAEHGLNPIQADSLANMKPGKTTVAYDFARDETSILARVMRGRAAVGVVSNTEWNNEIRTPAFRDNLRVIAETQDVVRSLTLVRASLPDKRREALKQALIALSDDDAAAKVRDAYFHTTKFVPLSDGVRKDLSNLRSRIARHMPEQ